MIVDIFNTNNTYNVIYADPPWQYTNNYTRGRIRADMGSVIDHPVMKHSKKPDVVRNLIAELFDSNCIKLELFARQEFRGWDCWGNEV